MSLDTSTKKRSSTTPIDELCREPSKKRRLSQDNETSSIDDAIIQDKELDNEAPLKYIHNHLLILVYATLRNKSIYLSFVSTIENVLILQRNIRNI